MPPPRAGGAAEGKASRLRPRSHWPGAVIARRAVLAAGLLAALPARAQKASLRLAQYKAGDQPLPRLAGLAAAPYRAGWFEFGSGNLMLEAVSAGSLDLAYGSEVPPAFAALSGAPIRIVAVARGGVNEPVVLVPSGSSVQSIAKLRGKRVGYVRATTTHCFLFRMLEEAGLSWSDIQPVNLTPADGQAAFRAGSLDAWMPGRSTATRCRGQSRPGRGCCGRRRASCPATTLTSPRRAPWPIRPAGLGLLPRRVDVGPLWDRSLDLGDAWWTA